MAFLRSMAVRLVLWTPYEAGVARLYNLLACCLIVLLGTGWVATIHAHAAASGASRLERYTQVAPADTLPGVRFNVDAAAGSSQINSQGRGTTQFVTLGLMPEFHYRQLGIGLLLRLRVHPESGTLRDEDFDDFRDYLALLYFIQYGGEDEPGGYGRFGNIEEVSLGYGLFVDQYTNEVSLDHPMRGFMGGVDTDHLRIEGVYSDFVDPGVFGMHVAYLPFGVGNAPAVPRLTFGAGLAAELNDGAALVNPVTPGTPFVLGAGSPTGGPAGDVPLGADDGPLYMVGVDAGIRWIGTEPLTLLSFAEAATILEYGAGVSLGIRGRSQFGRTALQAQYVQRFLGKEFLPDYFNSTYEAERIRRVTLPVDGGEIDALTTRRNRLAGRQRAALGFQARLEGEYADAFESTISYETIWGEPGSARFHFDLELHAPAIPVSVRLGYDRFDMETWRDVFTPSNENALYRLGVAVQVFAPLRLGAEFRQTYEPVYRNQRAVGQEKQNRAEPFVQLVWSF